MHQRYWNKTRSVILPFAVCALAYAGLAAQTAPSPDQGATPSVGYPATLTGLILPAPRVVAQPIETRQQPLVVRILETYKHGTDFRYDIEFYGLEPGTFDVSEYLIQEDSTPADHLPEIPVTIVSSKSEGGFPTPTPLESKRAAFYHFYETALWIGAGVWLIGLLAILLVGRKRKIRRAAATQPKSVADRLRPLVEQAAAGTLDDRGKAELERTLEAFWRRKLNLNDSSAMDLRKTLRDHPQAQEMLKQFDVWLYRPGESEEVDIDQLLAPYQSLAADELPR